MNVDGRVHHGVRHCRETAFLSLATISRDYTEGGRHALSNAVKYVTLVSG